MGLVRAVSIGFRAIEYAFMDRGGVRFVETEVYELSAVTIPANADALITEIKSIGGEDAVMRAIKAIDRVVRHEHGVPDPEIPVRDENALSLNGEPLVRIVQGKACYDPRKDIPEQPKEAAATGKTLPVVKLASTARDRAPFVIRRIHPAN
jgi:hypothetical protein